MAALFLSNKPMHVQTSVATLKSIQIKHDIITPLILAYVLASVGRQLCLVNPTTPSTNLDNSQFLNPQTLHQSRVLAAREEILQGFVSSMQSAVR